jgi:hypothetical protein
MIFGAPRSLMSKTGQLRGLDHPDTVEWQVLRAGRQPIRSSSVKIIAFDRFKPGVKHGDDRAAASRGGRQRLAALEGRRGAGELRPRRRARVVIVFEVDSVDEAQASVADLR